MEKQQLENLTQAYLKVLGLVKEEKIESLDEKCATKKEEMDPVDKKALKKDFKDREDKDIDNDGDEDESDEYLHNRRKAISKAVKEDVEEVDEAKQPHKFGDTWKSYDAIKKIFHRGFDKKDWTPDEVASVKKHVKIAGRKERGLRPGTGPMDFSAGAMHDHIVKHAKSVKEELELDGNVNESSYEKDLDPNKKIIVKGVKGMKSTPFTKKFKNMAAYDKWSDSDAAGDYEVHQIMNESTEEKYGRNAAMLINYVQEARENYGNMNNGSPEGEGLSPNAKKEKARKVEISHDAEKANMQNFKDFTAKVGVAKKRPNDNDVGDKNVVK